MLIASLAIQSIGAKSGIEGLLADAFATALSIAILLVVFERPRERAVMAVVLAGSLVAAWEMLTIGYADVTPVRAAATTFALLASLFGVFYTAVVVSQLVGMAQSRRIPPGEGS